VRVAIPRMGETVAPCFEYCCTMAIYTAVDGRILDQMDFPLRSREPLDRVRLLRDQHVDTLICGGMQDVFEKMLRAGGFEVISWVSGSVEDLLDMYLRGRLVPGTELPERGGAGTRAGERTTKH
jgi:predicted Fe-Mo cluster-binding NifX family protein